MFRCRFGWRALESFDRMSPSDKVDLFVKAGLLPESEAPKAVERLIATEKDQRKKPKVRRSGPAKKAAKQPGD